MKKIKSPKLRLILVPRRSRWSAHGNCASDGARTAENSEVINPKRLNVRKVCTGPWFRLLKLLKPIDRIDKGLGFLCVLYTSSNSSTEGLSRGAYKSTLTARCELLVNLLSRHTILFRQIKALDQPRGVIHLTFNSKVCTMPEIREDTWCREAFLRRNISQVRILENTLY